MALILITGLALAVYFTFFDTTNTGNTDVVVEPMQSVGSNVRDQIAAQPMLQVTPEDATSGTPALTPAEKIIIPPPTDTGAAGIPTGFPQTEAGAAAQLGEILASVLGWMDLNHARQVQAAWIQDPEAEPVWPVLLLVQGFLEQAGMPLGLESPATMWVVPVAAQIKGSDGPGWVVACVLLDLTYTNVETARIAYGHCERMAWDGTRWLIAEGSHPPPAPSTWPGTDLARQAGWLTWEQD
ncbi:hypothetical protein FOJ82_00430 [Tessaracoccus rhinocerotis]|uniref:Uncharacterized protein n=1 Tax=Tessaracoccus rhinocerotis TaxID=1689449 RepID=A0A553K402_9ACTN|nr:hypothetical protein [Tessaracoccus rhinocerotis]TRY19418.1 hypothetical protein FOJ82_00430 [Tessaracoccus rhinocerotis]